MTTGRDIRADLEHDAPDPIVRLAERLTRERPVPAASFRGDLRRHILAEGPSRPRPARLWLRIGSCAGTGAVLLLLGAVSALGAGPLGA